MFEERSTRRQFFSAPQSVTSLVAAFLEPGLIVAVFLGVSEWSDEPILRPDLTLCLLIFALTFPGRNRFYDRPLNAAVDISTSWISLLLILLLCGYATRSLHFFDPGVLLWWALMTPALLWCAVFGGRALLRWEAARPENRRRVVIIGAGELGVRVSQALVARGTTWLEVLGHFDDRTGDRVHAEAAPRRLGTLTEAAPFIRAQGVHEVWR